MRVAHPAGNAGPSPGATQPLLSYRSWSNIGKTHVSRYVYGYPYSHLYQLDVHHIPISGVRVTVSFMKYELAMVLLWC